MQNKRNLEHSLQKEIDLRKKKYAKKWQKNNIQFNNKNHASSGLGYSTLLKTYEKKITQKIEQNLVSETRLVQTRANFSTSILFWNHSKLLYKK